MTADFFVADVGQALPNVRSGPELASEQSAGTAALLCYLPFSRRLVEGPHWVDHCQWPEESERLLSVRSGLWRSASAVTGLAGRLWFGSGH